MPGLVCVLCDIIAICDCVMLRLTGYFNLLAVCNLTKQFVHFSLCAFWFLITWNFYVAALYSTIVAFFDILYHRAHIFIQPGRNLCIQTILLIYLHMSCYIFHFCCLITLISSKHKASGHPEQVSPVKLNPIIILFNLKNLKLPLTLLKIFHLDPIIYIISY